MVATRHTPAPPGRSDPLAPWRIYQVSPYRLGRLPDGATPDSGGEPQRWQALCERLRQAEFNALLIAPPWQLPDRAYSYAPSNPDLPDPALDDSGDMARTLARLASLCARHGLALLMDVVLDRMAAGSPVATANPGWYVPATTADPTLDPRVTLQQAGILRLPEGRAAPEFLQSWIARLVAWAGAGVAGFRCDAPHHVHPEDWTALLAGVRQVHPDCRFLAWTPGMTPGQLAGLRPAGFDAVFSSVPWWDYRSAWLAEEDARLRAIAPVIAVPQAPYGRQPGNLADDAGSRQRRALRALWTAAVCGDGLMVPAGFETCEPPPLEDLPRAPAAYTPIDGAPDLWPALNGANSWLKNSLPATGRMYLAGGSDGFCTSLARGNDAQRLGDSTDTELDGARLLLLNPDNHATALVAWSEVRRALPDGYAHIAPGTGADAAMAHVLQPAGCALFSLGRMAPVRGGVDGLNRHARTAMRAPRIAIEAITPLVDGGAYPVKCTLGETLRVEADILMDGHDKLRAALLWRPADSDSWNAVPMEALPNDRWAATFTPERLGPHQYAVCAWYDAWATFRDELQKKHTAGVPVDLEVREGMEMLRAAGKRARPNRPGAEVLAHVLSLDTHTEEDDRPAARRRRGGPVHIEVPPATAEQIEALLSDAVADAMHEFDDRPFEHMGPGCPLTVDRVAARFASWYEIFPRSQSPVPGRHGTFDDVIARLPAIRDMGFDVLYFPPIHPIGLRNRKGRNNSLRAGPEDPGSPYAIGSAEGGHDAIHPELGTLEDFQRLIDAAHRHGLEIALDFAIQCSPDHPWLTQHPDWFAWRADGSLRYAENPPKKYEDIVNVDFYGGTARVSRKVELWRALRDVVLFWAGQGVRTFRVDNPHTKPLPFWEWLIADVRSRHPDVIFLSEAFTRPKMMYRLAKVGFTQSYTYFTWRHGKAELIDYLNELSSPPAADFFRPHFFVNTPDINPRFLQVCGRPGYLIRAALAATTSGLWGVYNGFELCEGSAVPGKEEYLNSEKYELRHWDWNRPGNIVAQITRLNQIRRANPALQTQRGFSVLNAANDQLLCFWKATPDRANVVMVAISLDPYGPQSSPIEIPLWAFNLPDDGTLHAEDLVDGHRHTWHGKQQHVTLTPEQPYRIWRLWARA